MEKSTNICKQIIRYKGKWYKIQAKEYEPEDQTFSIAWDLVKGKESKIAYIDMFKNMREDAKLLYPVFRKDE
jgi:hypothetical protein